MTRIKYLCVGIFFIITSSKLHAETQLGGKGMYVLQFSWDNHEIPKNSVVELSIQGNNLATSGGFYKFQVGKNRYGQIELKPGRYKIKTMSINFSGKIQNKTLYADLDIVFQIKSGMISNGGLVFIELNNSADKDLTITRIDNRIDVQRALETIHADMEVLSSGIAYASDEQVNAMRQSRIENLVKLEKANPRSKRNYIYSNLGILIKLVRDDQKVITDYSLIDLKTLQEIESIEMNLTRRLKVKLGNNELLLGTHLEHLEFLKLPSSAEYFMDLHKLKNGREIMVDKRFNLYEIQSDYSVKSITDFRRGDQDYYFATYIYQGPKHLFVYSSSTESSGLRLVTSTYEELNFKEVELSRDIKTLSGVVETSEYLIIGPQAKPLNPAGRGKIFVQMQGQKTWQVKTTPRGDCTLSAIENSGYQLGLDCAYGRIKYQSTDLGKSWNQL